MSEEKRTIEVPFEEFCMLCANSKGLFMNMIYENPLIVMTKS